MIYKSIVVGSTGICSPKFISLGKRGENKSTTITIDCSLYAAGEEFDYQVIYGRPDGLIYPLNCTVEGDIITVVTSAAELKSEGVGRAEIRFMHGEVIQKTCVFTTVVERGIIVNGEQPDPDPEWFKDLVHSDGQFHPEGSYAVWDENGNLSYSTNVNGQIVWHPTNEQLEFIGFNNE